MNPEQAECQHFNEEYQRPEYGDGNLGHPKHETVDWISLVGVLVGLEVPLLFALIVHNTPPSHAH